MKKILVITVCLLSFTLCLFAKGKSPGELATEKFKNFFKGRGINAKLIVEKDVKIPSLKGYNFVIVQLSKGKRAQNLSFLTNGKYMIRSFEEIGKRKNLVSYFESIYTEYKIPFSEKELMFGKNSNKVKIVYFGDFECPFCKKCIKFILSKYKNDVALYFKHFPLPFHKNAILLAKIYEAGKKMNIDLLDFVEKAKGDQKKITEALKKKIPADKWEKFKKIMDSKAVMEKIKSDEALGRKYKVRGTPAIFINGHRVDGCDTGVIADLIKRQKNKLCFDFCKEK